MSNAEGGIRINSRDQLVTAKIHIRKAIAADVPRLREMIEASVRGLQAEDYSPAQIEGALQSVYGVDSQLIADGTYFVVEDFRLAQHRDCRLRWMEQAQDSLRRRSICRS